MKNSDYFNKSLQETINDMDNDEMNSLLLEMENTRYWIAILKYNQSRMVMVQHSLATIDPIEKATEMCRNQGILMGMSDLQSAVIMLKNLDEKRMENDTVKTKKKGN